MAALGEAGPLNEPPQTVLPDPRIVRFKLFAWIGEDEMGSGQWGIKQALSPAGYIPMVATDKEKMDQGYIVEQLARQAAAYGKTISLVRFSFEGVEKELPAFPTG